MKELTDALAKAQAKMKNAPLNRENPYFHSKYADLASIRDAIIPVLAAEGIALIQAIETREYGPIVVTRLMKADQQLISECPIILGDTFTTQQFGSALTYARRYSLAAIAGIAAEEDDDANAANETGATPKKTAQQTREEWKDRRLGKTAWSAELTAFVRELESCDDIDQLDALLDTEQSKLLQRECYEWMPQWWSGHGDMEGLGPRIARLKTELSNRGDAWEGNDEHDAG